VIQYLVAQKGFRLIAIEWQPASGDAVERYLQGGAGTAAKAAATLSVWSSEEDAALLGWLRGWNVAHPSDVVHFVGFDVQQPDVDRMTVTAYLDAAANADATTLEAPLAQCDTATMVGPSGVTYVGDYAACTAGLDAIDAYLTANQPALVAATTLDRFQRAQLASVGLRAWQGEAYYFNSNLLLSYQARDDAMAQAFLTLRAERYPGVKAIAWAHNYHLRQSGKTVSGVNAVGARTMGMGIASAVGDDYFPIGQVAYDLAIDWPGAGCGALPAPSPGSIPGLLAALPLDDALIDLAQPGLGVPLFAAGQATRRTQARSRCRPSSTARCSSSATRPR
jgi:erythromycin esterase-like protein